MNQITHQLFQKLDRLIDLHQKHLESLQKLQIAPASPPEPTIKHVQTTAQQDADLNRMEADEFGGDMSAAELAALFGETHVEEKEMDFSNMSIAEIDAWQKSKDDSIDIYKVKARVTNLSRESGVGITPNGEAMINTYVHVLMSLYSFADKIKDVKLKKEFVELVRTQEGFPGDVIRVTIPQRGL